MKIKMQLLSDVVFGNGVSIPGGEDISILCDEYGFPYYKGGTFKGVFREELERYLNWTMEDKNEIESKIEEYLGKSGTDDISNKLFFSDFHLSEYVKKVVLEEIKDSNPEVVKNAFSHIRTFTGISEDGVVKEGTLRTCRCVNKGLYFYSEIICEEKDKEMISEVLSMIKWLGSMRNRGFGKVKISVE